MSVTRASLNHTPTDKTTTIYTHGDADGIAAGVIRAQQLTNTNINAVAGSKYDRNLAEHAHIPFPDQMYFQDLHLDDNIDSLCALVQHSDAKIHYVDHHPHHARQRLDALARNKNFSYNINTDKNTSTAQLVNEEHAQKSPHWAIIGLFGDRINDRAQALAKNTWLKHKDLDHLRDAAHAVNYNSFALSENPVHLLALGYDAGNAVRFATSPEINNLVAERGDRLASLRNHAHEAAQTDNYTAHVLPDTNVARGLFAEYAYEVSDADPGRWHAIIVPKHETETAKNGKRYDVSLRGPHSTGKLAKQLGGGGRETAGGAGVAYSIDEIITHLDASDIYEQ